MMNPDIGVVEWLVSFIVVALSLALPVGILFVLFKIYIKLRNIEELLKKNG